jgi:hypothetical protein
MIRNSYQLSWQMLPEEIQAQARSVTHLATHLEELKQAAQRLRERAAVRERGYFSPSEAEAASQLLISYWMSRAALYEVILGYRDAVDIPPALRPTRFLIAYAAAILLVDAARFLRESYHDQPAIRAELNRGEPAFGIPPDVYDTVQQSLTKPQHIWHLYHALRFQANHAEELQALGSDPLLAPLVAILDRRGHRLQVSLGDYAIARLRADSRYVTNVVKRTLVEQALYGLQKLACLLVADKYVRPGHQPALPADVAEELRAVLCPGDVLVNRKDFAVTNYFLPGYWPHAALYLGSPDDLERMGLRQHEEVVPRWRRLLALDQDEPRRVLEALRDGVWLRSLRNPFRADAIAVVRPQLDDAGIAQAIGRGMVHESKPYDFDFDFSRSDRLVCTEVVYRSYDGIGGMRFSLLRRAGRLTIAAEDLLRMALDHNSFEPVAVYAPAWEPRLVHGHEVDRVLRSTLGSHSPQRPTSREPWRLYLQH